jgi:hypothetical protein
LNFKKVLILVVILILIFLNLAYALNLIYNVLIGEDCTFSILLFMAVSAYVLVSINIAVENFKRKCYFCESTKNVKKVDDVYLCSKCRKEEIESLGLRMKNAKVMFE